MPLHDFRCENGHLSEHVVAHGVDRVLCPTCFDGLKWTYAEKVFLRAPMGFVRQDICYDSPIDGRPITSMQARIEDLARSNCVPYEEGIKQDGERIKRESEEALERSFDQTVERELATMPTRKLEKLTAELEGGMSAEPARITPPQQSFRTA
jgi:hypothetical protein